MLHAVKQKRSHLQKKALSAKIRDTQLSVSGKADDEEEKDGDTVMEDAEFPKIRGFKLDKFLDQFDGTDRDIKRCL